MHDAAAGPARILAEIAMESDSTLFAGYRQSLDSDTYSSYSMTVGFGQEQTARFRRKRSLFELGQGIVPE